MAEPLSTDLQHAPALQTIILVHVHYTYEVDVIITPLPMRNRGSERLRNLPCERLGKPDPESRM